MEELLAVLGMGNHSLDKDLKQLSFYRAPLLPSEMINKKKIVNVDNTTKKKLVDNETSSLKDTEEGSVTSVISHRSASISKDGSINSFQRNSTFQSGDSSSTVETSTIGSSKTSGKDYLNLY